MKVTHGIITFDYFDNVVCIKNRSKFDVELPEQFIDLIKECKLNWETRFGAFYDVEFTYIKIDDVGESIAVVCPIDHFCRKIGREIALGRLRRAAGLVQNKKPYEIIPQSIILY